MSETFQQSILQVGKEIGLTGQELQDYVKEQVKLKQEEEREQRALERDRLRQADADRELENVKIESAEALEKEKLRLAGEERLAKDKLETEKLKLEQERLQLEREKTEAKMKNDEEMTGVKGKNKLQAFNEETTKFDAFLNRFENYATARKWKKTEWALQLSISKYKAAVGLRH